MFSKEPARRGLLSPVWLGIEEDSILSWALDLSVTFFCCLFGKAASNIVLAFMSKKQWMAGSLIRLALPRLCGFYAFEPRPEVRASEAGSTAKKALGFYLKYGAPPTAVAPSSAVSSLKPVAKVDRALY